MLACQCRVRIPVAALRHGDNGTAGSQRAGAGHGFTCEALSMQADGSANEGASGREERCILAKLPLHEQCSSAVYGKPEVTEGLKEGGRN